MEYDRLFSKALDEPVRRPSANPDTEGAQGWTYLERLYEDGIQQGIPMHIFNPKLFIDYAKEQEHTTKFSTNAMRKIMDALMLRTTMFTEFTLPDGTKYSIGKDLKGMTVQTVELSPRARDRRELEPFFEAMHKVLLRPSPRLLGFHMGAGNVRGTPVVQRSTGAHRRLAMASTSADFVTLTQPRARVIRVLNSLRPRSHGANIPIPEHGPLITLAEAVRQAAEGNRDEPHVSRDEPHVPGGVVQVSHIAASDNTLGLQWFFYLTREHPRHAFPVDRASIVLYVCHRSPKLAFAVHEALDLQRRGKRGLFFVNHPLTSMILNALLVMACVPTLHITSQTDLAERDSAVARFGDPSSHYVALVTSFAILPYGVDFHRQCHHGYLLEEPRNLSMAMQVIGRLYRIGQEHDVVFKKVVLRNSYDSALELIGLKKYADIIAADATIDPRITGELRRVVGFYLLQRYFGQQSSRFSRLHCQWNQMDDAATRLEGQFYSALGEYMFNNPQDAKEFTVAELTKIASCWAPGVELVSAHFSGEPPSLPEGVVGVQLRPRAAKRGREEVGGGHGDGDEGDERPPKRQATEDL